MIRFLTVAVSIDNKKNRLGLHDYQAVRDPDPRDNIDPDELNPN